MLDHERFQPTKFSIFSIFTFSVLIILLYAYRVIYCDSLTSSFAIHVSPKRTISSLSHIVIPSHESHSMSELEEEDIDDENQNPPVPPLKLTKQERILWFRQHLHQFKILRSNNLTRQFHTRVSKFFRTECEAQFFMTWISPASLFGIREMLSLQSVFKVHPRACLMIISRTLDSKQGNRILKPVIDGGFRVEAVTPDLELLFKKTPAESWLQDLIRGKKDPGDIPLSQNLSNLIRLVVLYKYGGIYLDTDFIVLKSFKRLRNSIGAQSMDSVSWTRLNNAVMVFDKNHPLLFKFIQEFSTTFNGNKWGYNGPYMVSRVVQRLKEEEDGMSLSFTVLPPVAFYPVDWIKIVRFFKKPVNEDESKWIEAKLAKLRDEGSYGVHLWNGQTKKLTMEEGSVLSRLISNLVN